MFHCQGVHYIKIKGMLQLQSDNIRLCIWSAVSLLTKIKIMSHKYTFKAL